MHTPPSFISNFSLKINGKQFYKLDETKFIEYIQNQMTQFLVAKKVPEEKIINVSKKIKLEVEILKELLLKYTEEFSTTLGKDIFLRKETPEILYKIALKKIFEYLFTIIKIL